MIPHSQSEVPQNFYVVYQFLSGTVTARSAPLLVVSARSCAVSRRGEYPDRSGPLLVQHQWSLRVSLCAFHLKKIKNKI